jgi:choline-sulfatase
MPATVASSYNRPREGVPDTWSPYDTKLGGFWQGGKHWSEVVADDAIDFLAQATAKKSPPFFLYVAFNAPHDPRQAPKEYVDKYPLSRISVPKNFLPAYPHRDSIGCEHKLRDENLAPMPRTEHAVKVHRQEYYAAITHLDAQVGRILDALDRANMTRSTMIFFTADHGLAIGHHGLFGKQNLYEHSTRVPFIVAGPDVPKNQHNDNAIYLQDVMATALDLAQAERPKHVYFHSLLPLLRGEQKQSSYPSVYGAYLELQRSITHDGWKLIVYQKAKVMRLYHLTDDPQEMKDVASDPAQAKRKSELFDRLLEEQKKLNDRLDLKAIFAK